MACYHRVEDRGSRKCIRSAAGMILLLHLGICASSIKHPTYSFIHDATEAPAVSYYDYIIVGGGTTGCPLAATLSQKYSVLVLERGGSPFGNPNITKIEAFEAPLSDLSPSSPSQRFISEDGVVNARARVLGGGSCLNAGFYTRAAPDYIRDAGWDGNLVNESYRWVERKVAFKPVVGKWQSAVKDGLLEVGLKPYNGFTYDQVYGTKIGGTIFDEAGNRHTAADLLQYADPKRITVLLRASVNNIMFRTRGKLRPIAYGVMFRDSTGAKHEAYLRPGGANEVIVSAGAIGSPQLLMLSGVGPADHLRAHNITVVLDQPLVGQGMSDNPMNAIFVPSPIPVEYSLIQVVGVPRFGSYIEAASGRNFISVSFDKIDHHMLSPKIGLSMAPPLKRRNPEAATFQGGFILEKIMGPLSMGHLELRSRDPTDNPSVTFNYFKEPEDLRRCVEGIKTIEKVIMSRSFAKFKYDYLTMQQLLNITLNAPLNLIPKHQNSTTSLEQYCRESVMTIWHYHGGCHVGKVVDRDYKVIGVDALRVIDGSTFIYSPGTNPQATVMMLGRYMGVQILNERNS